MVPKGAGVTDGVVVFAGVVVNAPGWGVVIGGVTTADGVAAAFGTVAGVAGGPLPAAAVCAPAATAESTVQATAKQAIAKKAPVWRPTECGFFMCDSSLTRTHANRAPHQKNVERASAVSCHLVTKKSPQRFSLRASRFPAAGLAARSRLIGIGIVVGRRRRGVLVRRRRRISGRVLGLLIAGVSGLHALRALRLGVRRITGRIVRLG
jgi:hypothetical protein